jgi:phosphate-selective porin
VFCIFLLLGLPSNDAFGAVDTDELDIEVKYNKGLLFKTPDDNYTLKLNFKLQPFFIYADLEDDNNSTVEFRRARILAGGNVMHPWLKYETQITLEGGDAALRDATIEAVHSEQMKFTVGQFKVPFGREFLVSGFGLQLIERSLANLRFALRRDIGVQIAGERLWNSVEYRFGIFNGSGANKANVDSDYMCAGRLVWTPVGGGSYPYWQAALNTLEELNLAVGFGFAYMPDLEVGEREILAGSLGDPATLPVRSDVIQYTTDFALTYLNFSLEGGYHYREIKPKEPTTYGRQDGNGLYVQGGYFIVPRKIEIAARYAVVEPDNPRKINNNKESEITGGWSYYFSGHQIKLQANYSLINRDGSSGDGDEHLVLASLTLQF